MSRLVPLAALCAAAAIAAPAQAAVVATLTFDTPTGIVFSNEDIEVWVTLTLAEDSDPIATNEFGEVTAGVTDQDIMDAGFDPELISTINVSNYYECSGTFTIGCSDPGSPYAFDFNYMPPSFIGAQNLDLQPGSVTSWHFGTFSPNGGNAAAGLYTFYNTGFFFQFSQPDENEPGGLRHGSITFAQTCQGQNAACAFTREVLAAPGAVPEPATWAMMITGFGAAGAVLRRRRAAASLT